MLGRLWVLLLLAVITISSGASSAEELSVVKIQRQLLKRPWSIMDRETVEQRETRALLMAQGLRDAAQEVSGMSRRWLVATAMSIWWYETRFSLEVHRGGRSRWGSDDGRAKCFGQLHERSVGIRMDEGETLEEFRLRQKAVWKSLAGENYEATKACALATMRAYLSKYSLCQDWVGAHGSYGSGQKDCQALPTSEHRHLLAKRLAGSL